MSMSGLTLHAMLAELACLGDAKIDKVQQPDRDTLVFSLHGANAGRVRLMLNIHSENGRLQLTQQSFENPAVPPAFCMLLRKHLVSARITRMAQDGLDRVLTFTLSVKDGFLDETELLLVVELTGKHGNVLLVQNGVILGCLRHIGISETVTRPALPGLRYRSVPPQDKRNPLTLSAEELSALPISSLYQHASGLDKRLCALLPDSAQATFAIFELLAGGQVAPHLHPTYGVLPFACAGAHPYPTLSLAADTFFSERDVHLRMQRQGAALVRVVENALKRAQNRLVAHTQVLASEEQIAQYRHFGELLLGHHGAAPRGAVSLSVTDYYLDPPADAVVPISPELSPAANAQRYFRKYQKGKTAVVYAASQLDKLSAELDYLEGQLVNLAACASAAELDEIREELTQQRYLKPEKSRKKRHAVPPSAPLRFTAPDGTMVEVGKNNTQNDRLTRAAAADEYWLHAKDIPGSHVVAHTTELTDETLRFAAGLAAFYSKARGSDRVPVDYARRRYVKKPSGARPGFVTFTNQHTLYVKPADAPLAGK